MDKWKDCAKSEASEGVYGRVTAPPIDRALAKVRELREAEKRMTEGPWAREACVIHGKDYGCTGVETKSKDGYELCRGSFTNTIAQIPHGLRVDGQPAENMIGIDALAAFVEGKDGAD